MHVTYENTVGELIILNLVMVRLVRCFEILFSFFFFHQIRLLLINLDIKNTIYCCLRKKHNIYFYSEMQIKYQGFFYAELLKISIDILYTKVGNSLTCWYAVLSSRYLSDLRKGRQRLYRTCTAARKKLRRPICFRLCSHPSSQCGKRLYLVPQQSWQAAAIWPARYTRARRVIATVGNVRFTISMGILQKSLCLFLTYGCMISRTKEYIKKKMERATAVSTGPLHPGNSCMGMFSMSREEHREPMSTGKKLSWRANSIIFCRASTESLQMNTCTEAEQMSFQKIHIQLIRK